MAREPLYLRVERDLASRIADGDWAPGDYLPSEEALQERYLVSRTTIRKAVADLVASGLLVIDRGIGTRVTQRRAGPISGLLGFSQAMRESGRTPGVRGTHACLVEAPPAASPASKGERHVHLSRVHTADGLPVSLSESWLPANLLAGLDLDRLVDQASLYATLATFDLAVAEVVDSYGVTPADEQAAAGLDLELGSALLLVDRLGYAADQRLVETSRILVCPQRYRPTVITRS